MAARAMWKGVLSFGRQRVPIKLYSAVEDRKVRFHLLHDADLARVEQRMVDPASGEEVPWAETRKGFPVESGTFVLLDEEELGNLEPAPSRDVEITRFVPAGTIDHQWYDRPYWLGPDGDAEAYFALATALREAEREGVARWVMRGRRYAGALRVEGDHLALLSLRHAEEVVPAAELRVPAARDLDQRELELARQLIDALADDFDPGTYRDSYRGEVEKLIAAKAKGKTVRKKKDEGPRRSSASLEKALAASLKQARQVSGTSRVSGTRQGSGKRRAAG